MNNYLIVGPCAAESREQVLTTARQITAIQSEIINDKSQILIFRSGSWKPRTSPDTFKGVGEQGLEWLMEVKRETGLPVATEAATPEHVKAALQAGIDYLWIGARTSANPIAVEAISQELIANSQKPKAVLIKNPANPDARLWLGNIARIEATGVPVMAVHRGCAHRPCWDIAYAVRQARPDIPMLLDPSHMTGKREAVLPKLDYVEQLGLDGAMIEVHYCPEQALSDAKQQITPAELLSVSRIPSPRTDKPSTLSWYRAMIDEVDEDIWTQIEKRMHLAQQIGDWKKQQHMTPLQPERFEAILSQRIEWAKKHCIETDTVQSVMNALHQEALRHQQ